LIQNHTETPLPLARAGGTAAPASRSASTTGALGRQFSAWMQSVNETQGKADQLASQMAIGDARSMHAVMVASEEASLQLSAVLQVRSKALEAYQEVMRMQV
jgi:flagellar hook-basal body complex protein FliE